MPCLSHKTFHDLNELLVVEELKGILRIIRKATS